MKVVVIADDLLRAELLSLSPETTGISWQDHLEDLTGAGCCIDLLFDQSDERIRLLADLDVPLVIVNDVPGKLTLPANFVRINGWPTLLKGNRLEASCSGELKEQAGSVLALFGKEICWLPDQPGFVTPRVISMIINEAYLALGEKVSTREAINTAMKLGTNYPYGPFEWAAHIGLSRIVQLLESLAAADNRYAPAPLLLKDATTNEPAA